jgi:autotransporter-associated beta strand protein
MTGGKLSSSSTIDYTLANPLTLNGTMTLGDGTNTGALTFSGTTTIAGTTTLTVLGAGTILSGKLTGSAAFTKTGTDNLFLTGTTNDYSGAFTSNTGNMLIGAFNSGIPNQLATAASLTVSGGVLYINGNTAYATFSTPIISGQDIYVTNTASGGVTFTGTSFTNYTGSLRLYTNSVFGAATAQKITSNAWNFTNCYFYTGGGLTGSRSMTLAYNGTPALTYNGPLFLLPQSGTGIAAKVENLSSNTLTLTNVTQNLVGSAYTTNTIEYAATNGNIAQSNAIQDTSTGSMGFIKSGSNAVTLTGDNTFKGSVTVSAGTLNANSTTALGADVAVANTLTSGATLSLGAALNYSTRTWTINGTGVSTGGALVHAYAGTAKIGAITLGAASYVRGTQTGTLSSSILTASGKDLIAGAASGNTLSLTGGISGLGGLTAGFYSADTGTVALTTSNSYSGNTTLSTYGTLSLGNASALGTSTLVFSGGTLDASTSLTVTNALTVSANITFTGTAALTLSAAVALGASRTVTVNGSTLTLSGIVSNGGVGPYKLTKAGAGVLALTNTNTYSGGTDIGGTGTVQAGAVQALGNTGTVTLTASTATLQTLTTGGQNGKLTVAALDNSAGGIIKIGG